MEEREGGFGGRAGWIESWSWSGVGVGVAGVLLSAGGWGGDEFWVWCQWECGAGTG